MLAQNQLSRQLTEIIIGQSSNQTTPKVIQFTKIFQNQPQNYHYYRRNSIQYQYNFTNAEEIKSRRKHLQVPQS